MIRKVIFALAILLIFAGTVTAQKTIDLPQPKNDSKVSLERTISLRRSEREYTEQDLNLNQLSQILWAAQGITDPNYGFRTAPSAGALYPLQIHVVKKDGVFRYLPDGHKLLEVSSEDKRASLARASLGQTAVRNAPVIIVISANFSITQAKYGARAFRYVCMEIGHVAENIHLQVVSLGLASVAVGAFWDDVIKETLSLSENQDVLYLIPIGYLKK
ncbi:MAG: SagB/ThcOx family dehydrogenase [bacterium]